jgi:hypothetical protein
VRCDDFFWPDVAMLLLGRRTRRRRLCDPTEDTGACATAVTPQKDR